MNKRILIVLLALGAPIAPADDGSVKNALKKQYEKHLVVLRSAFQKGDQEFDANGKPLKDPQAGDFLVYGPILVQKLSVDSNSLRLEGPRVAFGYDKDKKDNNKKMVIALGKSIHVKIRLDHPLNSASEAQEMLDRIFFPDQESSGHPRPEYRRPGATIAPNETIYHVLKESNFRPPIPRYTPDPDYSDAARKAKYQGTVTLSVVIDKTGTVSRIIIQSALGLGLDENAVNKVRTWRFEPATRDGQPVAVETSVEVQFNLY
jgi:TonB family protein